MTSLRTGNELIDQEHAQLLALEQRLAHACGGISSPGEFDRIFLELLEYMSEHFISEERLMGVLPHDMAHNHKYQHAEISARLTAIVHEHRCAGSFRIQPTDLAAIISHWLREHIIHWDVPLAQFLSPSR